MLKKILFSLSFVYGSVAFATCPPSTCKPINVKTQDKNIILSAPDQKNAGQIYLFKNISSQSIWIDHPVKNASASAGWSAYLRPGNWSAMMVNRKNFALSCAVIKPGKVEYLSCKDSIGVYIPQGFAVISQVKGTYWLAEDKPWEDLLGALEKRGVRKIKHIPKQ